MPPIFAAILCALFIYILWRHDDRTTLPVSKVLWVPLIWLLLLGSRPLSFWLGASGGGGELDGNPTDRMVYLVLIFFAIFIISKRHPNWHALFWDNKSVFLFYGFLALTCLWADYSFVTFKRWFKDIAAIFVLLVILAGDDPKAALQSIFTKCAIVLFSLSVILIKYFGDLGRAYSASGGVQITGVTEQKNALGEIIMVFGIVLLWRLIERHKNDPISAYFKRSRWLLLIMGIGIWLLLLSDSKTAQICLFIAIVILFSNRLPIVGKRPAMFIAVIVFLVPLCYILNSYFSLTDSFLYAIGRNPTLTNRTEIWDAVKLRPVNPVIGCGYLMYWDVKGKINVGEYEVELRTAHNGYLDIYLDGGAIGVACLLFMLFCTGLNVTREFLTGSVYGRVRLAYLAITIVYNVSESSFGRRGPLWFAFLLFCIDYRQVFPRLAHWMESPDEERNEDRGASDLPRIS